MRSPGYPRYGDTIVPVQLRQFLRIKAPFGLGLLSDLGIDVWDRLSLEKCRRLGDVVISTLRPQKEAIKRSLGLERIADGARRVAVSELRLETRTREQLRAAGVDFLARGVADLTIGTALGLPRFRIRSLVDLLTAVESFLSSVPKEAHRVGETISVIAPERLRATRYPRRGSPIVPILLKTFVHGRAPFGLGLLRDVGPEIWNRLDDAKCRGLAKIVLSQLAVQKSALLSEIGKTHVAPTKKTRGD